MLSKIRALCTGLALASLGITVPAAAQSWVTRSAALPDPAAIALPIGPESNPGAEPMTTSEVWDQFGQGNPVVRNVTQPTLTPVLPAPAIATGAAVIVAPGGGYLMLSMETEGYAVARQLAARGIAAFVLKYRLEPTPVAESAFLPVVMKRFGEAPRTPAAIAKTIYPPATADALTALRMIRGRAGEWHVDPQRVGIIGFSAGAMAAMALAQTAPAGEGPAFVGYIYGPQAVDSAPPAAPPLFDALAIDDPLFHTTDFPVLAAWLAQKRPAELHVYGSGGHGFGLGTPGQTDHLLIDEFLAWLGMQGFLAAKAGAH